MPVHDWTLVDAGLFHDFHQGWSIAIRNTLNSGILPKGFFALIEQSIAGPIPDVLTLEMSPKSSGADDGGEGLAVAEVYAAKANRITVRHRHGKVIAVVEIVSPGNKSSRAAFRSFVEKTADLIHQGVHLLVIDIFPPGKRDPFGIHKAIWDEFDEEDLELPPGKLLTLASYDAGPERGAYVNFVGVGDVLTDLPVFIRPEVYVPVPLEATYETTWCVFPSDLKGLLE